jgi:nicotinamide-nucleotide amidase
MFTKALLAKATRLLKVCKKQGIMITTVESCTGGLIAALLTEIAGSSSVFDRGFVTYSNDAKNKQLGLSAALIKRYGAVSAEVAAAMATGALKHSQAQLSVAVTGIAGPGGGTKKKPVGLVYISVAYGKEKATQKCRFKGSRTEVRLSAVKKVLEMLTAHSARFS